MKTPILMVMPGNSLTFWNGHCIHVPAPYQFLVPNFIETAAMHSEVAAPATKLNPEHARKESKRKTYPNSTIP